MSDADLRLDRLAPRQHGAFSRAQARQAGFTPSMVKSRLSAERWRPLDPAVYALSCYPPTWEQRCVAAVLAEPKAVLGGKTAAVIHGLPDFRPGAVEITAPPSAAHPTRLARVHRSRIIDARRVRGLRVNSVEVTLFEVAGRISEKRLDRAFEDAVLRRLTSMESMTEWFVRLAHGRSAGIGNVRRMLEARGDGFVPAKSELEAMLFAALDDPRIPLVVRQAPFPWSPSDPQRVDGFIEPWAILVEADGRRWHARLATMDDDRRRDQEAVRRGFRPLRFGWVDLRDDPERVRRVVIDAGLLSRAWEPTHRPLPTEPSGWPSPSSRCWAASRCGGRPGSGASG